MLRVTRFIRISGLTGADTHFWKYKIRDAGVAAKTSTCFHLIQKRKRRRRQYRSWGRRLNRGFIAARKSRDGNLEIGPLYHVSFLTNSRRKVLRFSWWRGSRWKRDVNSRAGRRAGTLVRSARVCQLRRKPVIGGSSIDYAATELNKGPRPFARTYTCRRVCAASHRRKSAPHRSPIDGILTRKDVDMREDLWYIIIESPICVFLCYQRIAINLMLFLFVRVI